MTRRLAPDEQALWKLVTSTVQPLHPARPPSGPDGSPAAATPPAPPRATAGPRKTPRSPPTTARAAPAPPSPHPETLDASWDRRLASGRAAPDLVIDLHGLRREEARRLLYARIADASARGLRLVLVITGKGSSPGPAPADLMDGRPARGAIRADLPRWLGEDGLSGRIAAVRQAHPRHGGSGAAYLILRRRRN